jgi:hypothetical protein
MCTAVSRENVESLLQEVMGADDTPSPNDAVCPWPSGTLHAFDQVRDAELAEVLNRTEFMKVCFCQKGRLSLLLGQLLFEMIRHPEFDIREVSSYSIVRLHRLLERPVELSFRQVGIFTLSCSIP